MEVNNQRIHSISNKGLENKEIRLCLKREDEIHSVVSGNKFRKLKYNLMAAIKEEKKTFLTFSGAFQIINCLPALYILHEYM